MVIFGKGLNRCFEKPKIMCLDINKYPCNWSLRRRRERKGENWGRKETSKVLKNLNVSNMNGKHQTTNPIGCTTPRRMHQSVCDQNSRDKKCGKHS